VRKISWQFHLCPWAKLFTDAFISLRLIGFVDIQIAGSILTQKTEEHHSLVLIKAYDFLSSLFRL